MTTAIYSWRSAQRQEILFPGAQRAVIGYNCGMAVLGKWIDGISAECGVTDAARLSVQARLAAVKHQLPLAALEADQDIEYVHRLRVSTRRSMAALQLYDDFLPRKRGHRMRRDLKQIRRAAGRARDLDVLTERLRRNLGTGASRLLAELAAQRAAAQPAIVEAYRKARAKDQFGRRIERFVRAIHPRGPRRKRLQQASFGPWARQRLTKVARRFFAAAPRDRTDFAALHNFRIQGKRLRYTIELLDPALPSCLRDVHYPTVERLQEHLGTINDTVNSTAALKVWARNTSDTELQATYRELITLERERGQSAVDAFFAWWTDTRAAQLRVALLELANGPSSPSNRSAQAG